MKPNPLALLNHFTLPLIRATFLFLRTLTATAPPNTRAVQSPPRELTAEVRRSAQLAGASPGLAEGVLANGLQIFSRHLHGLSREYTGEMQYLCGSEPLPKWSLVDD